MYYYFNTMELQPPHPLLNPRRPPQSPPIVFECLVVVLPCKCTRQTTHHSAVGA